jgi:hypothetical protein
MKFKGVTYDVGMVMDGNWRPSFDMKVVHRELEIIQNDLHCNAVRICGFNIERLMKSAEDALEQGLNVWLSPAMWDKSPQKTMAYIIKAAGRAEMLRQKWPDHLVLVIGGELTLFMQGIVPGKNVTQRFGNPASQEILKAGKHNAPLNAWLALANEGVRKVFHGRVSYASLVFETVDWSRFDFVGIDHYRAAKIKDKYIEMLQPAFAIGKPVIITEFGVRTYKGADTSVEGLAGDITDFRPNLFIIVSYVINKMLSTPFGIQRAPVRFKLKNGFIRDEEMQARELVDQLETLDKAGVEGTFVSTFISPIAPYNDDARYDFDMNSYSLVKTLTGGKHGTTYPDMVWEPKKSFKAVCDYYSQHQLPG